MINIVETNTDIPVCPYCEKDVHNVLCREINSTFGRRYIYFCAECKKVLGVSQRKGFWMG